MPRGRLLCHAARTEGIRSIKSRARHVYLTKGKLIHQSLFILLDLCKFTFFVQFAFNLYFFLLKNILP